MLVDALFPSGLGPHAGLERHAMLEGGAVLCICDISQTLTCAA